LIAEGHALYFEYCDVEPQSGITARDIAQTEFFFLLLHEEKLLSGNLKADGISLFPDPLGGPKAKSFRAGLDDRSAQMHDLAKELSALLREGARILEASGPPAMWMEQFDRWCF
jgi:hypothetical protein